MRLIDSHCHFDDPIFNHDRSDIQREMTALGITDVVFPATTVENWPRLKKITDSSICYHASYGLHPMFMPQHKPGHIKLLRQWLTKEPVVAIGECGLDFFISEFNQQAQETLFIQHLQLAREFELPLIIHARKSLDIILKHIRRIGELHGVIHSFSGSQQQADKLIQTGFYLGIGGTVTYERAKRLRQIVKNVPASSLLLETDAPDQPDSQWRGKRNEPCRLPVIAAAVAEIRGTSLADITAMTTANATQLFSLDTFNHKQEADSTQ